MNIKTITFLSSLALLTACGGNTEVITDVTVPETNDTLVTVESDGTDLENLDEGEIVASEAVEPEVTETKSANKPIEKSGGRMEKAAKAVKTDLPGKWIMTELSLNAVSSNKTKVYYIEFFENDNSFTAYAGCNHMTGNYKVNGTTVKFSDVMQTKMACSKMADEQGMLSVLSDTHYFSIEDGILKLMNARKNVLAKFN